MVDLLQSLGLIVLGLGLLFLQPWTSGKETTVIPVDLPESLTLEQLRHIWGQAEAEDQEALDKEDDRVNTGRNLKHEV